MKRITTLHPMIIALIALGYIIGSAFTFNPVPGIHATKASEPSFRTENISHRLPYKALSDWSFLVKMRESALRKETESPAFSIQDKTGLYWSVKHSLEARLLYKQTQHHALISELPVHKLRSICWCDLLSDTVPLS